MKVLHLVCFLPLTVALRLPLEPIGRRQMASLTAAFIMNGQAGFSAAAQGKDSEIIPAPPITDDSATRVGGERVRAVIASAEELAELKAAAKGLELPDVPKGSDLDKLFSGEVDSPSRGAVSSPRAHGR
jgi:hypothetical protein